MDTATEPQSPTQRCSRCRVPASLLFDARPGRLCPECHATRHERPVIITRSGLREVPEAFR